jgi:hypothetical protein
MTSGDHAVSEPPEHAAVGDCERIRPGWIGQPANTVSSLAFVAAAVPIVQAARRRDRPAWIAVAAALVVEGAGSVAYHGPGGPKGKFVHDRGLEVLGVAIGVAVRREGRAWRPGPRTVVLSVAAVTLHRLSRTGGPLCSCNSPLQGHAVFHVLAAAAAVEAARGR